MLLYINNMKKVLIISFFILVTVIIFEGILIFSFFGYNNKLFSLSLHQDKFDRLFYHNGIVARYTQDTGPSGNYAYFLQFVDPYGERQIMRFHKKFIDNVVIYYFKPQGELYEIKRGVDLQSFKRDDRIVMLLERVKLDTKVDNSEAVDGWWIDKKIIFLVERKL